MGTIAESFDETTAEDLLAQEQLSKLATASATHDNGATDSDIEMEAFDDDDVICDDVVELNPLANHTDDSSIRYEFYFGVEVVFVSS